MLLLVGQFLGFCVYIFDIAILFQFQRFVWGVLGHVCHICFCGIVAIAILISLLGWW